MLLQKDNLTIRNALANDAATLGAWWRDGKVMAHAGFPHGLNITNEQIAQQLATDNDDIHRRLIIEVDSIPIGEMNYRNKGNGVAEVGIKICDSKKQEKGYGTKLLHMLFGALFLEHGYQTIILDTNIENKRAQHVYEKLGFKKVRTRINAWRDQDGQLQSSIDYELPKADYLHEHQSHRPANQSA